jgi:hypothetical protein
MVEVMGENGGRLQNIEEDQIHPRALPHAYIYGTNVFTKIVLWFSLR